MNILVIGNGFDLAHGLPTGYTDFLEFCKRVRNIYTYGGSVPIQQYQQDNLEAWNINADIKERLLYAYHSRKGKSELLEDKSIGTTVITNDEAMNELYTYIEHNTWLEYFLDCPSYVGENWIDFESEISRVIQALDAGKYEVKYEGSVMGVDSHESKILVALAKAAKTNMRKVYKDDNAIREFTVFLNEELENLIRALEIYIAEFVGKIEIKERSIDIASISPNYIVSFNYSNTYEREYGSGKTIEYDYIHGKADIGNTIETNNMVLGIDEYLGDKEKNEKTDFICFKKYYQRIHKTNKRLTENWCTDIKKEAEYAKLSRKFMLENQIKFELEQNSSKEYSWQNYEKLSKEYDEQYEKMHAKHNVYIFGHSLDVTDKDILRNLILNDNVYTTIFYCKKRDANGNYDNGRKDKGQKITNLVKIIGQEELTRRTGGGTKTIEFVLQQDMLAK